ncbi:hypothetical protein P171DRAFT_449574 [Karstenula rhodostoma CBS 690.94]|uniref:Uncharacterized protein n=1 Tax=Karstenula rhodostoma CBS 690.94 TaxID=1392251 RepID=A0A9P4P3U7_9PLEO|nr:hypothetical protein P171DRAFT_449574 [Karstenula rhodostoma CBS 690.94]
MLPSLTSLGQSYRFANSALCCRWMSYVPQQRHQMLYTSHKAIVSRTITCLRVTGLQTQHRMSTALCCSSANPTFFLDDNGNDVSKGSHSYLSFLSAPTHQVASTRKRALIKQARAVNSDPPTKHSYPSSRSGFNAYLSDDDGSLEVLDHRSFSPVELLLQSFRHGQRRPLWGGSRSIWNDIRNK